MKEGELGKVYHDGEIIFREGEKGEVMYVVQSGKVRITRESTSGELTLGVLQGGAIFGEMALFDKLPRSATAVASGDARVLSVDRKKLFPTISKDPTLLFKILETMSQRIRGLDDEIGKLKKQRSDVVAVCANIEQMGHRILEGARNIIDADSGSLMLLDEKEEYLSVKAAFGPESDTKIRLKIGEGIAGKVLKTGLAELVNNASDDPRFLPGAKKVTSMLCVPIGCEGRNFGVINMSTAAQKSFSANDLKLLCTLAVYASMAIESELNFFNLKNATDDLLRHATMLEA
ncbi:MAG: cyclic nucleotide-binding domain-containing protein [Candidatus Sulfobium sp.]|jgi:putative methionine-R-sulfoxide reductase with GAF domain